MLAFSRGASIARGACTGVGACSTGRSGVGRFAADDLGTGVGRAVFTTVARAFGTSRGAVRFGLTARAGRASVCGAVRTTFDGRGVTRRLRVVVVRDGTGERPTDACRAGFLLVRGGEGSRTFAEAA